jgi:dephospho-CoA kinase
MTHQSNLKILAFVGMTGSGKSTAVDYFTKKGFPRVYFGGVVINAVKEAGLEVNEANERIIREKLRAEEGNDFIAQRIITQIKNLEEAGQHRIIADGIYSWTEYKALQQEYPGNLILVAVISPRHMRYNRLATRSIRPLSEQEASSRDYAEIENMEKGGPIAIADHYLTNDGSMESFEKQLHTLAELLDF